MSALELRVEIDSARVQAALAKAPSAMLASISRGLLRGAKELARDARAKAPRAFSTLTHSIKADRVSPLEYRVAPHVDYARYVEEGREPGKAPDPMSLLDWIRRKKITSDNPKMDQWGLAYVIARSIARKGIAPQPYLEPAFHANESRVLQMVRDSIEDGLRRAGA